jgi:Reverse transcriptase (RNA-dependent DNA polymerase)
LQALVEKQWLPTSWDFETAFLQGSELERDVFIAAPAPYIAANSCWRLRKAVYRLVSAPKAWYDRLKEVIQCHGFDADLSDEAIFRLLDAQGNLIGVLAIHVDDTIGGGTPAFHSIMDSVAEDLKIGSKEQNNFHYKGLRISTVYAKEKKLFHIVVDGDEYLDATIPMKLPALSSDSAHLPPLHASLYRSVVGCIGYMASSFRPDLSLEASLLSRSFSQPTLFDARKANATLIWAKENRYPLVFRRGAARLTLFADAAGPNDSGTQGGRVYALTDAEGHIVAGWIFWESRKVMGPGFA